MANLPGFKAEHATDPLRRGYAQMTYAEIAADLNTPYRVGGTRAVSLAETEKTIRAAGKWVEFCQKKDARGPDGSIANECIFQIMSVFDGQITEVNWRDGGYWEGLLDAAFVAGEIGPQVRDGWKGLSDVWMTRAQELGWPTVKEGWVERELSPRGALLAQKGASHAT